MIEKLIALHLLVTSPREEETGATATEYALLVAFIAFAIIIGVGLFGTELNQYFTNLSNTVKGWKSS
jgi:pilus assembly protein Flp/PilA